MEDLNAKTIAAIKALLQYSIGDLLMNGPDGPCLNWMSFTDSEQQCIGDEETCEAICEWLGVKYERDSDEPMDEDGFIQAGITAREVLKNIKQEGGE